MQSRTHLTLADVKEVLRDIAQESEIPRNSDVSPLDSTPARLPDSRPVALDSTSGSLDVSRLKLSSAEVEGLSTEIAALNADHHADRLQRLERSMMRIERINLQTLALLQKLVDAVKQH
jgi:general secretion pathway protein A